MNVLLKKCVMKKMIYLWAAFALPLLFVACSDDKNDDPVDPVL